MGSGQLPLLDQGKILAKVWMGGGKVSDDFEFGRSPGMEGIAGRIGWKNEILENV